MTPLTICVNCRVHPNSTLQTGDKFRFMQENCCRWLTDDPCIQLFSNPTHHLRPAEAGDILMFMQENCKVISRINGCINASHGLILYNINTKTTWSCPCLELKLANLYLPSFPRACTLRDNFPSNSIHTSALLILIGLFQLMHDLL